MDNESTVDAIKHLSKQNFLDLGRDRICYIRPVYTHGSMLFGLFNANGEELSIFPDEKTAKQAATFGELKTLTLH